MSLDAIRWAWMVRIQKTAGVSRSAVKLTLQSMADRANDEDECYPSIARLEFDTELNRKTIHAALKYLEQNGIISDTGKRKGKSGKVKVYKLNGVAHRDQEDTTKFGTITNGNAPENCTEKQAHIGDSPKSGTIPNLPEDSPKSGTVKSSQIWDTEPTSINQSFEPKTPCAFPVENALADGEGEAVDSESSDDKPGAIDDWCGTNGKPLPPGQRKIFETMWNAYGHKVSRARAIDEFLKHVKPYFGPCKESNQKNLTHFLKAIAYSVQQRAKSPDTTPIYFERWIKNRRWEDYEQRTDDGLFAASYSSLTPEEKAKSRRPRWENEGWVSFEAWDEYVGTLNQLRSLQDLKKPTLQTQKLIEELKGRLKGMVEKGKHQKKEVENA